MERKTTSSLMFMKEVSSLYKSTSSYKGSSSRACDVEVSW